MIARARRISDGLKFFLLVGCLSAVGPAAMDAYVPALPAVAADLHGSTSATQLTIAVYLVGLALGQLLFGQLSDVFGRRRPLLAGMLVFFVSSAACALASSVLQLCVGRLLQGLGAAAGLVITRAVVRDLYGLAASARYYSRLSLIYGAAPLIAPLIGAQILRFTSWHGIFLGVAAFVGVVFVGTLLWFPETLQSAQRQPGGATVTARTFGALLRDRRFIGCTLALGFTMGALVAYVSTASFVMQDGYGASTQLFAVLFGVNALAMVAGNQANAHLLRRFSPSILAAGGLCTLLVGAVGLLVVATAGLGLAALEACLFCLLGSWGFIQSNMLAAALANKAQVAGAGSALLGVSQYAVGAVAAPLSGLGGSDSPVPLSIVTLGFSVAAVAAAYLFIYRGRPPSRAVATPEEVEQVASLASYDPI